MLDQLQLASFQPLVGQRFGLRPDAGAADVLEVVLIEASALAHGEGRPRMPFSLIFRGSPGPVLAQRIYRLEHEELGSVDLFLVPVGRDADGVRYEAVFA